MREPGKKVGLALALAAFVLLFSSAARASGVLAAGPSLAAATPTAGALPEQSPAQTSPVYTLPPGKLAMARSLYLWRTSFSFVSPLWSILVLLAILSFGVSRRLRDWTASVTRKPWLQGMLFIPVLTLLIVWFDLPLSLIAHHVALEYGQSIQGWGSWFVDWLKALLLQLVSAIVIFSVVFAIIRASRRWWLWLWLISLPAQLLVVLILPVVVDPLFNHFEPLSRSHPQLVQQLERVVAKTGVEIPPSRMYLMRASEKVTSANAYVTGFGASKRVVVWDTAIQTSPVNEILAIFGHELGHYVLEHIQRGLILASILSFFFLWIGFLLAHLLVRRFGGRWGVASIEDWSAMVVLLLVFSILALLAEPIGNAISRGQEHEADVFGEEVIHGIVANPQAAAAESFQRLGEQALEYPSPGAFVVFWTYTHPAISQRKTFAANYNPWQPGQHPRYFNQQGQLREQFRHATDKAK